MHLKSDFRCTSIYLIFNYFNGFMHKLNKFIDSCHKPVLLTFSFQRRPFQNRENLIAEHNQLWNYWMSAVNEVLGCWYIRFTEEHQLCHERAALMEILFVNFIPTSYAWNITESRIPLDNFAQISGKSFRKRVKIIINSFGGCQHECSGKLELWYISESSWRASW